MTGVQTCALPIYQVCLSTCGGASAAQGINDNPETPTKGSRRNLLLDYSRPVRAICGVRMIWVCLSHRRRGIARRLLDAMRRHFVHGYIIGHNELAFTQLTEDGVGLVEAYLNDAQFCVYQ